MNNKKFTSEKNILDLEHSENLSRGITGISIGLGGFIAIILSITNKNLLIAIAVSCIFSLMFLVDGVSKLTNCKKIRVKI